MAAIEASLRRLKTDYVDLYYFHVDDQATPLEEAVRAVGDLIRAGKARYFGVSNVRGWRLAEVVRLCDQIGLARPLACQPCYNAATRTAEDEVIPAAAYYGVGVVPYSPLARSVLTGKYRWRAKPPANSRAGRRDRRLMMTEWRKESVAFAAKLATRARTRGMSAAQFALLWVLANTHVAAAIAGPRTLAQWTEYLGALDHRLTPADHAFVDRWVPPGHSTTFGYTDPAYPVIGRAVRT
jgi:aryl-alcohol dehydrogenase (NADP+)